MDSYSKVLNHIQSRAKPVNTNVHTMVTIVTEPDAACRSRQHLEMEANEVLSFQERQFYVYFGVSVN